MLSERGKTMVRFVATVIVQLALSAPAMAGAAEEPAPLFSGSDLFQLRTAADPQVRPDGRAVAYVRASGDVMADRMHRTIWLIDLATGAERPLAAGAGQHSTPRWSPDGTRLAYIASEEGGKPQLHVHWVSTGVAARVVALPEAPKAIAWSPDGKNFAVVMFTPGEAPKLGAAPPKPEGARWAEPLRVENRLPWKTDADGILRHGADQLYIMSADGGAPRQLTTHPEGVMGAPAFTPDGRQILFAASWEPDARYDWPESDIWRVPAAGGAPFRLTTRNGPDVEPTVSPDGRLIAYTGHDDDGPGHRDTRLYVMNADGSNPRALTAGLDRPVFAPVWAEDGRSIYTHYEDRGAGRVARVGLDGRVTPVAEGLAGGSLDRPYNGGSFHAARGVVAFTTADELRPADVAVADGRGTRRVTDLNAGLISARQLARIERLPVTSARDGQPIDAWLVLPPGHRRGERVPLILEIHGGPMHSYGPYFATDMQLYAAAGYAVLYANSRNSTSYGEAFARWYGVGHEPFADYQDLMSAVDAAIAAGVADPDRLFVTGGSYGGYATGAIIGKTDRFRAAAMQKPAVNRTSMMLTQDYGVWGMRSLFGKPPWEDQTLYWTHSPLSLVGNVKTPTLVLVGEKDWRTPASEAEQYYTALMMRGVPSSFIIVPGANHGGLTARPSQSAAKASAILAWFERYRK